MAALVPRGLSRAAALALGATLAITGCEKKTVVLDDGGSAGPDDHGSYADPYGTPPVVVTPAEDAATRPAPSAAPTGVDAGARVPKKTSVQDASNLGPDDLGSMGALYGLPAIEAPDAGKGRGR